MVALIDTWRPLYNRRRGGECDVWVPANQRSRARSTGALVGEDWRAVATAVNGFRTEIKLDPDRAHKQCQRRVERLKSRFGDKQLATPSWYGFVPVVYNNTAGGRGHSRLRLLATAAMETTVAVVVAELREEKLAVARRRLRAVLWRRRSVVS